ncbi:MAG TPA: CTP synthase, partial [Syntrophomonas sp.]|nr:CTP synthase [Syntrophomonas sp.]
TMRLGVYPCKLVEGSIAFKTYGISNISERHRHRYEINNDFRQILENNGMKISGLSPDERLVEIVEISEHPWFVACQFHPEFGSRPNRPHPLFTGLIGKAIEYRKKK